MQRGEKRGLDDTASASAATSGPPAHKKAREKMPDFDWSTDNFRMTWALVEELKRPENKSVLFPDQENLPIKVCRTFPPPFQFAECPPSSSRPGMSARACDAIARVVAC